MIARLHQYEAEEVESLPEKRVVRALVVLRESDAPDVVHGACLREHAVGGCEQELREARVLSEFRDASSAYDVEPVLEPPDPVETPDLASEPFRDRRAVIGQNFSRRVFVAEGGVRRRGIEAAISTPGTNRTSRPLPKCESDSYFDQLPFFWSLTCVSVFSRFLSSRLDARPFAVLRCHGWGGAMPRGLPLRAKAPTSAR